MDADTVKALATPVTVGLVLIGAIVFKKDLTRLVTWLVTFKRVSKTKDGYSLEGGPEVPKEQPANQQDALLQVSPSPAVIAAPKKDSWFDAMMERNYPETVRRLEKDVAAASTPDERIRLQALQAHFTYLSDTQAGMRRYEQLVLDHPTHNVPYEWWAVSLNASGQVEGAVAVLDRGIASAANKEPLLLSRVSTLKSADRIDDALATAERATADFPKSASAFIALGEVQVAKKELAGAAAAFEAALAIDPRSETARYQLASALQEMGAHTAAAFHFEELIRQQPSDARYDALLGNAYLAMGLSDMAMVAYRRANRKAEGKAGWILANIGNVLVNQGFYSDAIDYLQQAAALEPASEYVHSRLARALAGQDAERKREEEAVRAVKIKSRGPMGLPQPTPEPPGDAA